MALYWVLNSHESVKHVWINIPSWIIHNLLIQAAPATSDIPPTARPQKPDRKKITFLWIWSHQKGMYYLRRYYRHPQFTDLILKAARRKCFSDWATIAKCNHSREGGGAEWGRPATTASEHFIDSIQLGPAMNSFGRLHSDGTEVAFTVQVLLRFPCLYQSLVSFFSNSAPFTSKNNFGNPSTINSWCYRGSYLLQQPIRRILVQAKLLVGAIESHASRSRSISPLLVEKFRPKLDNSQLACNHLLSFLVYTLTFI
jgi:hypothetical protein